MEFKGTKAKWHSGKHGHVVNEFGETICQTFYTTLGKGEENYENAQANRKLIAAAPELLEALQDAIKRMDRCRGILTDTPGFNWQILETKSLTGPIEKALKP